MEVDIGRVSWTNSDYYDSVPAVEMLQRNIEDQLAWLEPKRPSGVEAGPANNRLDIVINIPAGSRVRRECDGEMHWPHPNDDANSRARAPPAR